MALSVVVAGRAAKHNADSISADSDNDMSPPTKKISSKKPTDSKASSRSKLPMYDAKELASLSHADLIAHAIALQKQLESKPVLAAVKELSPEVC